MAKKQWNMGDSNVAGTFAAFVTPWQNEYRHVTVRIFGAGFGGNLEFTYQADRESWQKPQKWYAGRINVEADRPDTLTLAAQIMRKLPSGWQSNPGALVDCLNRTMTRIYSVQQGYASEWIDAESLKKVQSSDSMGLWALDMRNERGQCQLRNLIVMHGYCVEAKLLATIGEDLASDGVRESLVAKRYTVKEWDVSDIDVDTPELYQTAESEQDQSA